MWFLILCVAIYLENCISFCKFSKICKEFLENKKAHVWFLDVTIKCPKILAKMWDSEDDSLLQEISTHTHLFSSLDLSAYKYRIFLCL